MRYSTLVNGYSALNLTKLDVLTGEFSFYYFGDGRVGLMHAIRMGARGREISPHITHYSIASQKRDSPKDSQTCT